MRIAVIGAGVVGSGLVRVFLAAGHSVVISSRHADRAAKVAAGIGAETVPYNQEAVTGADPIGTPAGTRRRRASHRALLRTGRGLALVLHRRHLRLS